MRRPQPRSTRTDTLFPSPTLFLSAASRRTVLSAVDGDRRGRLSRPALTLRGRLSPAPRDEEPPPARPRVDRRGDAGADHRARVAGRRLARTRGVRHVWRAVRRQSRPAPHPDRLWFPGPSAAQGFPAARLYRIALFRQ